MTHQFESQGQALSATKRPTDFVRILVDTQNSTWAPICEPAIYSQEMLSSHILKTSLYTFSASGSRPNLSSAPATKLHHCASPALAMKHQRENVLSQNLCIGHGGYFLTWCMIVRCMFSASEMENKISFLLQLHCINKDATWTATSGTHNSWLSTSTV